MHWLSENFVLARNFGKQARSKCLCRGLIRKLKNKDSTLKVSEKQMSK
jgi:hypothetical protein